MRIIFVRHGEPDYEKEWLRECFGEDWIEGDDPECKNDLLGGEIKMHIDITEEHLSGKKEK